MKGGLGPILTGQLIARKKKKKATTSVLQRGTVENKPSHYSLPRGLHPCHSPPRYPNSKHTHIHSCTYTRAHTDTHVTFWSALRALHILNHVTLTMTLMSNYYSVSPGLRCTVSFHTLASLKSEHSQWHLLITVS